jgi:hypothetical protein
MPSRSADALAAAWLKRHAGHLEKSEEHDRTLSDICSHAPLHADILSESRKRLRLRGTRKHVCHTLHRACLWRGQVIVEDPSARAFRQLMRMHVRGVHVGFDLRSVDSLALVRAHNTSAGDPALPTQRSGYSKCVPLIWWPVWGYNIGEYFQNSVLGIAELEEAGVVDRNSLLLTPEVGGWRLLDYHVGMLRAFSNHPVRSVRQRAPRCGDGGRNGGGGADDECPPLSCYERLLVCRLRDVYESVPPVAPWTAAQAIVGALPRAARMHAAAASEPSAPKNRTRTFTVLFASRAAAKNGARLISNEEDLLQLCQQWEPPPACIVDGGGGGSTPRGVAMRCRRWVFGKRGFERDVSAVRDADVLFGAHGAALVHSLFMRRGSALVEARPFGFRGAWPDRYHLSMAQRENATHAFVIQTTDRTLCGDPRTGGLPPPANVSAWDARPLNTHVQRGAFLRALAAAACAVTPSSRNEGGEGLHRGDHLGVRPQVPTPLAVSPFDYSALQSVVIDNGNADPGLYPGV